MPRRLCYHCRPTWPLATCGISCEFYVVCYPRLMSWTFANQFDHSHLFFTPTAIVSMDAWVPRYRPFLVCYSATFLPRISSTWSAPWRANCYSPRLFGWPRQRPWKRIPGDSIRKIPPRVNVPPSIPPRMIVQMVKNGKPPSFVGKRNH